MATGEEICRELETALRGVAGQWTEASKIQAEALVQQALKQEESNQIHRESNRIAEKTLEILVSHNERMTTGINFLMENCRECKSHNVGILSRFRNGNGNGNGKGKESLAWWEKVWLPLTLAIITTLSAIAGAWVQSFRDTEARTAQAEQRK